MVEEDLVACKQELLHVDELQRVVVERGMLARAGGEAHETEVFLIRDIRS